MSFIEKESKSLSSYRDRRIFTSSARAAMTFILQARKHLDPRGILLPAYIGLSKIEGSGVFDPVRASEINYAFYRVDQRLRPDLVALEKLLKSGNFQLVFLIHYFGVPQLDVEEFVGLCRHYDVQVIEDCAHTILGGLVSPRLGHYGDYAIYSIHKSSATKDGGFFIDHTGTLDVETLPLQFRISIETLAEFADTDLVESSRRRLSNFHTISGWLSSISLLEPFFESIPTGAVPLNCPVIVGQGKREELYFELIKRGVLPTALYHTLIPEIYKESYPQSHFVAANILNLPTHPDIDGDNLNRYEKVLRQATREVV